MQTKASRLQITFGLVLLASLLAGVIWLVVGLWNWFASLESDMAVGMLTASSTIIVATTTLVLGRYFERVKEAETHLRTQKIQLYDEFLKEFFELFYSEGGADKDLVPFLREWQRKLVVWGGPKVLFSFITWKNHLASGDPDAQSVFLMDAFFRAMRHDIGLSNRGLERGFFSHVILRHANFFLSLAKTNPKIKLSEVAEREKALGLSEKS